MGATEKREKKNFFIFELWAFEFFIEFFYFSVKDKNVGFVLNIDFFYSFFNSQ